MPGPWANPMVRATCSHSASGLEQSCAADRPVVGVVHREVDGAGTLAVPEARRRPVDRVDDVGERRGVLHRPGRRDHGDGDPVVVPAGTVADVCGAAGAGWPATTVEATTYFAGSRPSSTAALSVIRAPIVTATVAPTGTSARADVGTRTGAEPSAGWIHVRGAPKSCRGSRPAGPGARRRPASRSRSPACRRTPGPPSPPTPRSGRRAPRQRRRRGRARDAGRVPRARIDSRERRHRPPHRRSAPRVEPRVERAAGGARRSRRRAGRRRRARHRRPAAGSARRTRGRPGGSPPVRRRRPRSVREPGRRRRGRRRRPPGRRAVRRRARQRAHRGAPRRGGRRRGGRGRGDRDDGRAAHRVDGHGEPVGQRARHRRRGGRPGGRRPARRRRRAVEQQRGVGQAAGAVQQDAGLQAEPVAGASQASWPVAPGTPASRRSPSAPVSRSARVPVRPPSGARVTVPPGPAASSACCWAAGRTPSRAAWAALSEPSCSQEAPMTS